MPDQIRVTRDDWDAHWDHYAGSAARNPAQRMRHDLIARLLCQDAGKHAMRILDLGSGQGDLVLKLKRLLPKAEFAGVELSETGVAISQRKVPEATFLAADVLRPPAALQDFAGWATHAVCSEVLEHVDDPAFFLRQARESLAAGARLIVTVPGGPISAFDRHIGHRQHFSRKKIAQMLEAAGYRVNHVYRTGFPFFNLYRLVVLARGKRLALDAEAASRGGVVNFAMKLFGILFRGNLLDSPFGWQLVAVSHKALS